MSPTSGVPGHSACAVGSEQHRRERQPPDAIPGRGVGATAAPAAPRDTSPTRTEACAIQVSSALIDSSIRARFDEARSRSISAASTGPCSRRLRRRRLGEPSNRRPNRWRSARAARLLLVNAGLEHEGAAVLLVCHVALLFKDAQHRQHGVVGRSIRVVQPCHDLSHSGLVQPPQHAHQPEFAICQGDRTVSGQLVLHRAT